MTATEVLGVAKGRLWPRVWAFRAKETVPPASIVACLNDILADLQANSPIDWNGSRPFRFTLQRWHRSRRSWTATIGAIGSRRFCFVVKLVRIGESDVTSCNKASQEYDRLCRAFELFASSTELSVPKPYRLYPGLAAFATDHCNGHSVTRFLSYTTRILLSRKGRSSCVNVVSNCGRWLRMFHALEDSRPDVAQLRENQISSLLYRLSIAENKGVLSLSTVAALTERYVKTNDEAARACFDVGNTHHDFGPHNVLVSSDGIYVLDLGDSQSDFIMQDVARFCLELSILQTLPWFAANRTFFSELREAFLDAYGLDTRKRSAGLIGANVTLALLLTATRPPISARHARWNRYLAGYLVDHLANQTRNGFRL